MFNLLQKTAFYCVFEINIRMLVSFSFDGIVENLDGHLFLGQ